ncbi:MAG: 8-amino-7-oxononanoate synthase [Thermoguttaceae bacterium]
MARRTDNTGYSTPQPLGWIDRELDNRQRQGLRRRLFDRAGAQGARIEIAPIEVDGRELANFGSNDYLALAADKRLAWAVGQAIEQEGWGSGASPLITGHGQLHRRLEERLARFEKTEAALVFSSGFAANAGTVAALVGPGDVVYCDRKNHASLMDGCRLSRADVRPYPHCDWRKLEQLLSKAGGHRRRLIVTDGLFSMDGDLAPLEELAQVARRHDAMFLVDEAHATGVFGPGGRGTVEAAGVEADVHVRVGTLSKALGSMGGFVAGSRSLIEWLVNSSRPYIFSTAPPAALAAAALAALDIVEQEPGRREQLLDRARVLRAKLAAQGWHTGNSASQIIPIVVGEADRAMKLSAALRERGHFVPAIRPPTVPHGESCLRISLTTGHTEEMIEGLLLALAEVASS